jgi:hypothetical protein
LRVLPAPCASDAAPGVFGRCSVDNGVVIVAGTDGSPAWVFACCGHLVCGGGELGCPSACTAAMRGLIGRGVRDVGISVAAPIGAACMW